MSNFYSFVRELSALVKDEILDFLEGYFTPEGYVDYLIPDYVTPEEKKAVEALFLHEGSMKEKIDEARKYDPLCIEAFYIEVSMLDDVLAYDVFVRYHRMISGYESFTSYGKENYMMMLDLFIEYLLDISNIKGAMKIQKDLIRLTPERTLRNTTRLCYMYYLLEDSDSFYNYYHEEDLDDAGCFLLLIVTLLKNDDEEKAREVFNDMLSLFPYADYIDHMWELDDSNEEAAKFMECVNSCFDELCSVPYFFAWCSANKEEVLHA
ncbi:MAG: hypothetical protein IIZ33_05695 [Erysipelotrichaceae bacterium]|nr:hypothetical protein [Erysipelotrichaceae bacterium]